MIRPTLLLLGAALLGGCAITHYEARGQFGDTPAVLHWKQGDSALTLWRCGASPIPLSRGVQGQDDAFASDDGCIRFLGTLEAGSSAALGVHCVDSRYPELGSYPFARVERWRQHVWFGLREPAIPAACGETE
jgi:hypothetical protein